MRIGDWVEPEGEHRRTRPEHKPEVNRCGNEENMALMLPNSKIGSKQIRQFFPGKWACPAKHSGTVKREIHFENNPRSSLPDGETTASWMGIVYVSG